MAVTGGRYVPSAAGVGSSWAMWDKVRVRAT